MTGLMPAGLRGSDLRGSRGRVLVARLDSAGDVLISGPAVRAVAAGASHVVLLSGPRGAAAGSLLPGVDEVLVWRCPWIEADPPPVLAEDLEVLVKQIAGCYLDEAVILTSYHQSALPLAMLLRLAGVRRIAAVSEDYPGSLLDVRQLPGFDARPEPERQLSIVEAAGFRLPPGDAGRLAVRRPLPDTGELVDGDGYVVLHPGAAVPARQWTAEGYAATAALLAARGLRVVVTGGPDELALTRQVAGADGTDLGGRTGLAQLASVLDRAAVLVCGNTGPAHLAAAVGTPVVSLFAPVVPADWWAPYGVPHVLLGDQAATCRGSRARVCPVPGHPCLSGVAPAEVAAAVTGLLDGGGA
jgi:ADP-heptose:LPS heptosyltransferase